MAENSKMENLLKYIEAEKKAFEKEGLVVGKVYFTCPICGGEAVGNRYIYAGRVHGLGSGCTKCGISHT